MGEALRLMMEEAGERHFEGVFIDANGSQYEAIENTTWKELIDRGFIKEITRYGHVAFTSYGWRIAMIKLKRHESEDFKLRLGRLSAALKDSVKG